MNQLQNVIKMHIISFADLLLTAAEHSSNNGKGFVMKLLSKYHLVGSFLGALVTQPWPVSHAVCN